MTIPSSSYFTHTSIFSRLSWVIWRGRRWANTLFVLARHLRQVMTHRRACCTAGSLKFISHTRMHAGTRSKSRRKLKLLFGAYLAERRWLFIHITLHPIQNSQNDIHKHSHIIWAAVATPEQSKQWLELHVSNRHDCGRQEALQTLTCVHQDTPASTHNQTTKRKTTPTSQCWSPDHQNLVWVRNKMIILFHGWLTRPGSSIHPSSGEDDIIQRYRRGECSIYHLKTSSNTLKTKATEASLFKDIFLFLHHADSFTPHIRFSDWLTFTQNTSTKSKTSHLLKPLIFSQLSLIDSRPLKSNPLTFWSPKKPESWKRPIFNKWPRPNLCTNQQRWM